MVFHKNDAHHLFHLYRHRFGRFGLLWVRYVPCPPIDIRLAFGSFCYWISLTTSDSQEHPAFVFERDCLMQDVKEILVNEDIWMPVTAD